MAQRQTRRTFLQTTAAAATASMPYWFTSAQPETLGYSSASERPVLGCIGTGSRWNAVGPAAMNFSDCAAVCDVDANHAGAGKDKVSGIQKGKGDDRSIDVYEDYRKILDREDIDVVTIVTPDHWHSKIAIEAMKAGKDVYIEKPLGCDFEQIKKARDAVRGSDRVVQMGTFRRSHGVPQAARDFIQQGLDIFAPALGIADRTRTTIALSLQVLG